MNTTQTPPDISAALRPLKGFQRRTVEYAFNKLFNNPKGSKRFLVADEVGLGKTLVARGVVAKTIEALWDTTSRIDIVYICSNSDIARQNIGRLTIPGLNQFTPADRMTLLPLSTHQRNGRSFKDEKVNFIPLTPGTSFNMYSQFGIVRERALLYRMLEQTIELPTDGAMHVFSGDAGKKRFRYQHLVNFDAWYHIDASLAAEFLGRFNHPDNKPLRERLVDLCILFQQSHREVRKAHRWQHLSLLNDLRTLLATTCLDALEPDLVIMDEFQRFKYLLQPNNPSGELAQALLNYPDVRVLLLSATPYKMYTLHDETDNENHHADFLETLKFLFDNDFVGESFRDSLRRYRQALLQYGNQEPGERNSQPLLEAKISIESQLKQVMARTEKLTASTDRNGMFRDMVSPNGKLEPHDLSAYVGLQQISELIDHHNALEYWKSAPYLLNFMEEYKFKKNFQQALTIDDKAQRLAKTLQQVPQMLLSRADVEQYRTVDPGNARLRQLIADTIDSGAWQLLWVPPALPYYQLEQPFNSEKTNQFTKRLVFSAWHVVPKVIASLLSYEAERRIMNLFDETAVNSTEERNSRRGLLRIARSEDRPVGMPVLGIMYPSLVLAEFGDPLKYVAQGPMMELPHIWELLEKIQFQIESQLATLNIPQEVSGAVDEAWYWAGPLLLDLQAHPNATHQWWRQENLVGLWAGNEEGNLEEDSSAWVEHVSLAQGLISDPNPTATLGRPPADLSMVLALMALGGPGNIALRALSRIVKVDSSKTMSHLRLGAASVAWSFRALFNVPEAMALIRGLYPVGNVPYWQQVLTYSIAGCLQSVMDEYAHVLCESVGLVEGEESQFGSRLVKSMSAAIQLRTASLKVDDIQVNEINPGYFRLRAHFAQRFGDIHSDNDKKLDRKEGVREAFNSPFWPFILVTTSVGQEGLDFHQYCHAIVHWNLPANPVDLEQREGRVHRYKGHAIRKNVAHDFKNVGLQEEYDPWSKMFASADENSLSDLVPFWIYPEDGPAKAYIERYVPIMPLSRDSHRLISLRRALTVYRMVFGQNRQEDLVNYLLARLAPEEVEPLITSLQINLQPLDW